MSGIFAARRAAARNTEAVANQSQMLADLRKQQMYDQAFSTNQGNNYQQVPNRLSGSSKRSTEDAARFGSGGFFTGGGQRGTFFS